MPAPLAAPPPCLGAMRAMTCRQLEGLRREDDRRAVRLVGRPLKSGDPRRRQHPAALLTPRRRLALEEMLQAHRTTRTNAVASLP